MAPREFFRILISTTISVLAFVLCFNVVIDPYNQFGMNRLGVYVTTDRESKATDVLKFKHEAILLGNSRVGMIPPRQLGGFRFFNGAFGGGSAEEVYYFAYHFVKNQKVVVLGIDYLQSDPASLKGDIFSPPSIISALHKLLNIKTIEDSFRTISYKFAGKPAALEVDGTFNAQGWFKEYDRAIPGRLDLQVSELKIAADAAQLRSLEFYRKISALLKERGIPCVVYIPPLPEPLAEHIRQHPNPNGEAWLKEICSLFPSVVDLSFSSYGSLGNFFKADLQHLKPDSSAHILNQEIIPRCLEVASRF